MTVSSRKLIVVGLIGTVLFMANIMMVAHWLDDIGAVDGAVQIRERFVTGTAITIIVALLILLVKPSGERAKLLRRCPVCDHTGLGRGKYCSECGSRAT